MTTQRRFWSDTGQTCDGGGTSGSLFATPTSSASKGTTANASKGRRDLRRDICMGLLPISSVADSPASLFRWLEPDEGTVMSVGCGHLFAELSVCCDQGTWLSKTSGGYCQRNLDGSLEEFSETWPASGTMRNGKCYRQRRLVRRISAKEFSLLPTPVSNDDNKSLAAHLAMKRRMKGGPRNTVTSLNVMAKGGLLPTPYGLSGNHGQGDGEFGKAIRLLPTPQASEASHGGPNARDSCGAPHLSSIAATSTNGGQLNPQFVEAMMGLPLSWTARQDCDASETQ